MTEIEVKIKEISDLMMKISDLLDNVNGDNHNFVMSELKGRLIDFNNIRSYLKKHHNIADLKDFSQKLGILAKQIEIKFDSIISGITNEQTRINCELENIQNKKKLANYNR
ncbi:MAG: hypothetical protein WCJ01_05430 [Ignavibacteria bacterium]